MPRVATFLVAIVLGAGCSKAPEPQPVVINWGADKPKQPKADTFDWGKATREDSDGDIDVRVVRATIEAPTYRKEDFAQKADQEFLTVAVSVRNKSAVKKVDFKGLSGVSTDPPELGDEHGNRYSAHPLSIGQIGGMTIDGTATASSLYPGKSIEDAAFFELPVDAAKEFRLTIPGTLVGATRTLHLKFSRELLKN